MSNPVTRSRRGVAALGGIPGDVRGVTLGVHELTGGGALRMEATAATDGWTATGVLALAGEWQVMVVVRADTFSFEPGGKRCTSGHDWSGPHLGCRARAGG